MDYAGVAYKYNEIRSDDPYGQASRIMHDDVQIMGNYRALLIYMGKNIPEFIHLGWLDVQSALNIQTHAN